MCGLAAAAVLAPGLAGRGPYGALLSTGQRASGQRDLLREMVGEAQRSFGGLAMVSNASALAAGCCWLHPQAWRRRRYLHGNLAALDLLRLYELARTPCRRSGAGGGEQRRQWVVGKNRGGGLCSGKERPTTSCCLLINQHHESLTVVLLFVMN